MAGYGSDDGFVAWLSANGYELPDDAPAPAVLRERGSNYVDGVYGSGFPGTPTDPLTQERVWPRTDATVYGAAIAVDAIPLRVINASYAAAYYEATNPGALSVATTAAGQVKREKVGQLEVEYVGGSGSSLEAATPMLSLVEGLLSPLLIDRTVTAPAIFAI